jgi:hypothetical protein
VLDEFLSKGIDLAKILRIKYFKIACQTSRPMKERVDEITTSVKKSDEFKRLTLIQRMILNFAGGHE